MQLISLENKIIKAILTARFVSELQKLLKEYQSGATSDQRKIAALLEAFIHQLENPLLITSSVEYPQYVIPQKILSNNKKVRKHTLELLYTLLQKNKAETLTFTELADALTDNHESIKWSQNKWLLANAGITLELCQITKSNPKMLLSWLKNNFDTVPEDHVIEIHVVSSNGRKRLQKMDFPIPYAHWDRSYYIQAMDQIVELAGSYKGCKGLFCKSWIFNPDNFKVASDGRPYAAFTFLNEARLTGHILDITKEVPQKVFQEQYDFASRNQRRKQFIEKKEFVIRVYAAFYPASELRRYKEYFSE